MAELIQLDLRAIGVAADRTEAIKRTFESTEASARSAADATGHAGLSDAIIAFENTWDDRRAGFVDSLRVVAGSLSAIETAFSDLDVSLASTVENSST